MLLLETLKHITFVGKILGEFSVLGGTIPHLIVVYVVMCAQTNITVDKYQN